MGSMLYDGLIAFALVFTAASAFILATDYPNHTQLRPFLQLLVCVTTAAYFVGFWSWRGQTVGMKTWRIRVVRADGSPLGWKLALARFALATIGLLALGLTIVWTLFDRDRQFLHDRLLNTRLVIT